MEEIDSHKLKVTRILERIDSLISLYTIQWRKLILIYPNVTRIDSPILVEFAGLNITVMAWSNWFI